jgi:hypothetical protein
MRLSKILFSWLFIGLVSAPAADDKPASLSETEFEKLHRELQPPAGELWRTIPWKTEILDARAEAAKEKKPIFMLVRSGHPLGCV